MRYHFKPDSLYGVSYASTYICDHPVYDKCTLYLFDGKGLAVIQQYIENKRTYWSSIEESLIDKIYLTKGFQKFFDQYADYPTESGLYPTVTVRQIMWALRLKPLKREIWETTFTRKPI